MAQNIKTLLKLLKAAGNPGTKQAKKRVQVHNWLGRGRAKSEPTCGWTLAEWWSGGQGGRNMELFLTVEGELWTGSTVNVGDPVSLGWQVTLESTRAFDGGSDTHRRLAEVVTESVAKLTVKHGLEWPQA